MDENVLKAVKDARTTAKKRNFSQTFDLIVNVRLIDLKKPENRLNEIFLLPKGRGKEASVVIFADDAKADDVQVLKSGDIEKLGNDKRGLKKIARDTDFFLSEPKLMPAVGKSLGRILAPRGKMPVVLAGGVGEMIDRYKKSVRLTMKESPVIQCMVGEEKMSDEDIAENISAVLAFLERRLPKGRNNMGKVMIKLTMGKPVKVES
jgi:large subunit ribosomal protein L1